jgi:hypothetical protein
MVGSIGQEAAPAPVARATISFVEFNKVLDDVPEFAPSKYATSRWRRRSIWAMCIAAGIGLLVTHLPIPGMVPVWIAGTALVIEITALLILVVTTYRQEMPGITAPHGEYAEQLDFDTTAHFGILDWLDSHTLEVLQTSRDYTKLRRTRMEQKLPLLVGAAQTFGLLPLAGVIYLQVHEYMKVGHMGMLEGFSVALLAVLYFAGFLATKVKQRLDVIDMYLEEAVRLRLAATTAYPT